jgi:hypothetical protein
MLPSVIGVPAGAWRGSRFDPLSAVNARVAGRGESQVSSPWGIARQDPSISISHFDNHREMVGKSLPITQRGLFVWQSKAMRIEKPSPGYDVKIVSRHLVGGQRQIGRGRWVSRALVLSGQSTGGFGD